MRFFFDRCMSWRLARMVDVYDDAHSALALDHDDRFSEKTPDTEWLAALAADDPPWVVISGESRILRNKAERQVLRQANLTFFCMGKQWGKMKFQEYAWKFIRVWPEIVRQAVASSGSPTIFEVSGGHGTTVRAISRTMDPS